MSQVIKNLASGPVPPSVATTYVTDVNSPAIPALNILNVLGNDTTANDVDGIRTDGSSGSNTLTVQLTNRLQGTVSTADATPTPIITFTPTVIGTYAIEARVAAYNTTSSEGAGYSMFSTIRFDGANTNLCGTPDRIVNEEGTMAFPPPGSSCTVTVSGANVLINAVGFAGQSINWSAVGLYTFVGA